MLRRAHLPRADVFHRSGTRIRGLRKAAEVLDLCDRLGSQRAKSRAKCSIYDAFFPVSALLLAYLCRMLAIRV
jgi:hypothetical protein